MTYGDFVPNTTQKRKYDIDACCVSGGNKNCLFIHCLDYVGKYESHGEINEIACT